MVDSYSHPLGTCFPQQWKTSAKLLQFKSKWLTMGKGTCLCCFSMMSFLKDSEYLIFTWSVEPNTGCNGRFAVMCTCPRKMLPETWQGTRSFSNQAFFFLLLHSNQGSAVLYLMILVKRLYVSKSTGTASLGLFSCILGLHFLPLFTSWEATSNQSPT